MLVYLYHYQLLNDYNNYLIFIDFAQKYNLESENKLFYEKLFLTLSEKRESITYSIILTPLLTTAA